MPEQQKKTLETPRVDGFKVFAKLKGSLKEVESKLRTISFMEVVGGKDAVTAAYIESRDIAKNPYTFALFKFRADYVEVQFTIPPTIPPKKRKLDMVRYFLNLMTSLSGSYTLEQAAVLQLVDAAIKEMGDYASMDYNKLFLSYDTAKKDLEDVSRRYKRAQQQIEDLKRQNYELKTKYDEVAARLAKLEAMSDETLKEKVQEWISEHEGEINVGEFAKFYKVPETRVEEMLEVLVKEGFVQPLQ